MHATFTLLFSQRELLNNLVNLTLLVMFFFFNFALQIYFFLKGKCYYILKMGKYSQESEVIRDVRVYFNEFLLMKFVIALNNIIH